MPFAVVFLSALPALSPSAQTKMWRVPTRPIWQRTHPRLLFQVQVPSPRARLNERRDTQRQAKYAKHQESKRQSKPTHNCHGRVFLPESSQCVKCWQERICSLAETYLELMTNRISTWRQRTWGTQKENIFTQAPKKWPRSTCRTRINPHSVIRWCA